MMQPPMTSLQRALAVDTVSNPGSNTQLSGGAPAQPGSHPTIDLTVSISC